MSFQEATEVGGSGMKRAVYAIPTVGLLWTGCGEVTNNIRCGNGLVESGELCDDGNTVDTDACPSSCQPAQCADGLVESGVESCDDGNNVDTDACTNACTAAACGDRVVHADGGTEQCDDGNAVDGDTCTNACTNARCGDGRVFGATSGGTEQCDDANAIDTDGCISGCQLDPILRSFEIKTYKNVPMTDIASFQLCTSPAYGGCYAYTTCSQLFDSPLTMSMALVAAGSYTRTRDCADNAFDQLVTKALSGTAQVLIARQQYQISLTEDSTAIVLDCDMDAAFQLTCQDGNNTTWVLAPN